jgi:hypothetical protein
MKSWLLPVFLFVPEANKLLCLRGGNRKAFRFSVLTETKRYTVPVRKDIPPRAPNEKVRK